jgi:hypothetical protein
MALRLFRHPRSNDRNFYRIVFLFQEKRSFVMNASHFGAYPLAHAVVEDLSLGASVSKGSLTFALVQVAETVIVALVLGIAPP